MLSILTLTQSVTLDRIRSTVSLRPALASASGRLGYTETAVEIFARKLRPLMRPAPFHMQSGSDELLGFFIRWSAGREGGQEGLQSCRVCDLGGADELHSMRMGGP